MAMPVLQLQRRIDAPHIFTLPTELVTYIWYMSLYDPYHDRAYLTPPFVCPLSIVCRRWRNIALATPWLWAEYDMHRMSELAIMPLLLSRSGTSPLSFTLWTRSSIFDVQRQPQRWLHPAQRNIWKPALDTIFSNSGRIKRLELLLQHPDDLELFVDYLYRSPFPILQRFEIALGDRFKGSQIDTSRLFSALDTPKLCDLSLAVFPSDWSASTFRHLRRFTFKQRNRRLYPQLQSGRSMAQKSISTADIARLLGTAESLEELCVFEGYLHSAQSAIRMPSAQRLTLLSMLADCSNVAAFSQLMQCNSMSSVTHIHMDNVPASGAQLLLAHLTGHIDLVLWTRPPMVPAAESNDVVFIKWSRDDECEFGSWHLKCFDERGFTRDLAFGDERLMPAQMFLAACSDIMPHVRRLRVRAGQWWQISSALSRVNLEAVEEVVLKIDADRALGYEDNAEMYEFYARVFDKPIQLPSVVPLNGSTIRLPSITRLVLYAEHFHPQSDVFLPMLLTYEVYKGILASLGIDKRLEYIHLHDIRPLDDDSERRISATTANFVRTDTSYYSGPRWWRDADPDSCSV